MKTLALILLLLIRVQTQDVPSDLTYSGDGEDFLPTTAYASLIDENGDIENATDSIPDFSTIGKETTVLFLNELTSISTTPEETTSTVGTSTVLHLASDSFSTTTEASTTVASTTVASTTGTPTTESTSLTDVSTSTLKEDTTTTSKFTTNAPTRSSIVTESEPEPTKAQQISTEKTTYIPANGEKHCLLVDSDICEEEIFCYGEGIIDCTEEIESSSAETSFVQKISSSSAPSEYPEYEEVEEGIETFPPYLVGVKSSRKSLPFLFRMGSLGTTESSSENTENIRETFSEEIKRNHSNLSSIEEMMSEDGVETTSRSLQTESAHPDSTFKSLETMGDLTEMASSTVFTSDAHFTQEEPKVNNSSLTEMDVKMNATEEASVTSLHTDTTEVTSLFNSVTEVTSDKTINVRKKREESIASSSKLSFNVAAVDSSRKKSGKPCKLSGNLRCMPAPTTAKCRGKTSCQVLSDTQETSEKSTSTKGGENWTIAVIAICAVAAALTVSLLVYLIFTSWKKLKVQPQNGVTTLTYVNSTIP